MIDATRAFYDTVADAYAEVLPDATAEAPLDLGVLAHFVAAIPQDASLPVLDAGCGTGRMLRHLASHGIRNLVGVDLSPAMIAHARLGSPDIPLDTADLGALPLPDASVRAVLCWYAVIHSTPDELPGIVREFARVLAPGGPVAFGFQAGSGERIVDGAYGHDVVLRGILHRTDDVAALLVANGFDIVATADRGPTGHERTSQGFVIARRG